MYFKKHMSFLKKLKIIYDNLIPSENSLSIEEEGRKKLFNVFILILTISLIILGTAHIKTGNYGYGIIDYIVAVIFIALLAVSVYKKKGKPVYRTAAVFLELLLFYWIRSGAVQGYSSIWAMAFPIFAFYLLGKKEGFFWTSICFLLIILIFINPYSIVTDFSYPNEFITRHVLIFFIIFIITYNYESAREKYKNAVISEQAKLLLEKEKLAETKDETDRANRLLKREIRIREQAESELKKHHDHLESLVTARTLEIKKSNEELKESEERYRLMADNVDDLIWAMDIELNFIFVSPSVYTIYGYTVDEAMNLPHEKINTPESIRKIAEVYNEKIKHIKSGSYKSDDHIILQLEQIKKDGTIFPAELKISPICDSSDIIIGIVGITRDISDRIDAAREKEKIKDQLAESQKMEALGTLVGGLAHDFNNFLTGIIGSFDLLSYALKEENLEKRDYIEKYLSLGMESSKRSAGLIDQLLILSRRNEIKLSPFDIKNSLHQIYELCRNSLPKSIKLDFRISDEPLVILGDMVQIEQVLLNLCINASHAMTTMRSPGEKQEGTLTVVPEIIRSDYIIKENYPQEKTIADFWIRIRISDTGIGMDENTKQKIFEPFFSTKDKKDSSGLGLAISYNIIKKHQGIINVYSEPGSGSCFSIYFPVYNDPRRIISSHDIPEIMTGEGTVLIVDDEPAILNVAKGFVEQCKYEVITADGADKAAEIYSRKHSIITMILIDLSMPGKSGLEIFQKLKEINPDVKVILSSGMLDDELKNSALKQGIKETINKPYTAAELSMKLKLVSAM